MAKKKKKGLQVVGNINFDDERNGLKVVGKVDFDDNNNITNKTAFIQQQDIAPVKQTGFFNDAKGSTLQKIGNTAVDATGNILKGGFSSLEGLADFGRYRAADVLDLFGADKKAKKVRETAKANTTEEIFSDIDHILSGDLAGKVNENDLAAFKDIKEGSYLGDKGSQVFQGVGNSATNAALSALGGNVGGMTSLFMSAAGNAQSEAYQEGATDFQAGIYGALSGSVEAATEMMFGGLGKITQNLGFGTGALDDQLINRFTRKLSNTIAKNAVDLGLRSAGEGVEEVVAGFGNAILQKLTYMKDEDFSKLLKDQKLMDSFVSGALSSALMQAPTTLSATMQGRESSTGFTENEREVYNRELENRLNAEEKLTNRRRTQIEEQLNQDFERGYVNAQNIRDILGDKIDLQKDTRLAESFNEETRRTQAYENDVSKYDEKQAKVIQTAIDSGLLNNSNKTHDMVDLIAKLSADKGVDFDFTNNERIKDSGFAIDGRQVNGFVKDGTVNLNLESNQVLNKTVGHEITHVLEGTELYDNLQQSLKAYIGEKEWNNRISQLEKVYQNVKGANIENELTSDLVGEHIFNDENFIRNLSTKNPNLFQKIFDEIKYMVKIATAGSKEARDLEKVKRAFEKAYRETSKTQEGTQYSIKESKKALENKFKELTGDSMLVADAKLGNYAFQQIQGREVEAPYSKEAMDLYEKIQDSKQTSSHLYHSTPVDRIQSIVQNGLQVGSQQNQEGVSSTDKLYLSATEELADSFTPNDSVTLRISPNANLENLDNDLLGGEGSYTITNNIDPKYLQVKENGKWVNLLKSQYAKQNNQNTKYSLSVEEANTTQDNEGRKLSDNQLAYFKDSKAVDENGNLVTVYHTMTNTGEQFNEFNPVGTEGYRFGDQVVNFYTNSQVMSDSYANYKSTKADTSKLSSIEDAKTWLTKQNTLFDEYNIEKSKGDGYYITSNGQAKQTLQFENENDLLKNIKQRFYEYNKQFGSSKGQAKYQYEGYVNITNPYIIDAKEANWDNILTGYDDIAYRYAKEIDNNTKEQLIEMAKESERLAEESSNNWLEANKELSELRKDFIPVDKTIDELNKIKRGTDKVFKDKVDRAIELKQTIEKEQNSPYKYKDSYFKEHVQEIMNKLNKEQNMNYDENELYKMAIKEFVDESLIDTFGTTSSTNEIIKSVLNKNKLGENYDGVIIKNVMDYGTDGATFDVDGVAQDVYVTFNSNQFKAVDNLNPTNDADIRYQLGNNEVAPTSGWNVRSEDVRLQSAFQDTIAPLQEQVQELSNTINELKESIPQREYRPLTEQEGEQLAEEYANRDISNELAPDYFSIEDEDVSDMKIDKDLQDMTADDIDVSPFLEGLQKASDRQAERQQLREELNQKKEVKIPKETNGRKAWNKFKSLFVNEFAVVDDYAKRHNAPEIKHKTDTWNNYLATAQYNIETAQTDINGKAIGRSGNSIFQEAQKLGLKDTFDTYLKHWANVDRAKQGKGANYEAQESYKIVKEMEAKNPELKRLGKDNWQYYRNARHNLRDAGIISQEVSDMLGRMYPHYTPYVSENIENYFTDKGELKPKATIKRAKGGAVLEGLLSAEEAMQMYTKSQFNTIFGNDVFRSIVNTSNNQVEMVDNRTSYVNADNLYTDKDGYYLTAYENGDAITAKISEEMYKALSRESKTRVQDLENTFRPVGKVLSTLSNIRRNILTSWSPTFIAKNFIKDYQEALFNSKYTADFVKNYPSAFKELATNTGEAQQFKALYGSGLTMGQFDMDSINYNPNAKNFNFLKGIKNANELIELAPRYAEFKASIDHGASIQEAMYNAREVTTNFSRGGVITKAFNKYGMTFLNSSVQGFDKFIRNFSGENGAKGVVNSLAKAVIFGIAPAVFNELAFGSGDDKDEEYEALPDYIKDNYYIIKTGDGNFIRIPKGRVLSVFGSAARRTIEAMEGEENAFEGYWNNVQQQIGINNPEENNIFAPLIQAMGGRKLDSGQTAGEAWYGGDIIPSRLQKERPEDQYDASIDKLSIWLGQKTGISPYKINYVLDQYTGGIGDIGLPMITDEANSDGSVIAPIKDQFTADSTTDNKYVSEFYDTKGKLYTGSKATDEDILKSKYMNSISSEMAKLYAERREVQADDSLTKKQKYAKSQEIKAEINRLAKEGMDNYNDIIMSNNYAKIGDTEYYKNANGQWTKVNDDVASLGLDTEEKNEYYKVKNEIYTTKKNNDGYDKPLVIQDIVNSNLTPDAKVNLYTSNYKDDLVQPLVDSGMDVDSYLEYKSQDFRADKDKNGKSISGSKKRKVFDYINSMNIPYEQKLILAKSEYNSFNQNNYDIINYIENSGMSYDERIELYKNLGFKVDGDNISW